MIVSANRLELLQIADAVAREKSIDASSVIEAMTEAIQRAARAHYGAENDIRAEIDSQSGEIKLFRLREVVEEVENDSLQIALDDARKINPDVQAGESISDSLPPIDFDRIAAQGAKQVIVQKVRDAERERQYEEYKDRIGEVINGIVKQSEYGSAIVDLGRGEAVARRDDLLPRESFRAGDRIRAFIYDVRREPRGAQIFLSRTRPEFMTRLFTQEVPEIYDGIVEIRAVARDPGSRAKIAVISNDSSIDPVGACVGMRGNRVQAVVGELQGEKIDIIPWSPDPTTLIVNALAPAEVTKAVLDEDARRVEIVVAEDQLSLAIGRRGQNVRLASQLTGWVIDILTEAEESERRQAEFTQRSDMFAETLDVDETIAQLLASEGFSSVEDVVFVDTDEITGIAGFGDGVAEEIQQRAKTYLEERAAALEAERKRLGVVDALADIPGVTGEVMVALGSNGMRSMEDLAGCATDDLTGWFEVEMGERVRKEGFFEGLDVSSTDADAMIMAARLAVGWISPVDDTADDTADDTGDDTGDGAGDDTAATAATADADADADADGKADDDGEAGMDADSDRESAEVPPS